MSILRKWSRAHRGVLSVTAIHALELKANAQNIMTTALMIRLSPSGLQEPRNLKVDDAYTVPLDTLREVRAYIPPFPSQECF